jgi:hypothetical protein
METSVVVVHKNNGGVLRIGTDDAENLARFLEGKVSPDASPPRPRQTPTESGAEAGEGRPSGAIQD